MTTPAGMRDLLPIVPQILLSGLSISNSGTAVPLAAARILASSDATYGTVGWLPPTDGSPFAVIDLDGTRESEGPETYRIRVKGTVTIFIAIESSDVPAVQSDYHDQQLAWGDALRQFVASNRRLSPSTLANYPIAGDVRWQMLDTKNQAAKPLLGGIWRGVECVTSLEASIVVNFQG